MVDKSHVYFDTRCANVVHPTHSVCRYENNNGSINNSEPTPRTKRLAVATPTHWTKHVRNTGMRK